MKRLNVKDSRMYSLIFLYDMHTDFFSRVTAGISDKDAHNRLNTKANHVAWLTGSLVQERYELANVFGIGSKQKADDLFKDHKGIQDHITYPSLAQFKNDWDTISPALKNALADIDETQLDKPFPIPDMVMPYYDLIAFMIYREANCIGQIALWRRLMGYEAMKYM